MIYGAVSFDDVKIMFDALKKLEDVVVFKPFERYLNVAVKISLEDGVTIYDVLYLTQRRSFGVF